MKYSFLINVGAHDLLKPYIIIIDHLNPSYAKLIEVYGREFFLEKGQIIKFCLLKIFGCIQCFCSTSRIYRNFFQRNIFSGVIAKNVQRILNVYRQQDSLTPILLCRITDVTAHSPRVRIDTKQQNSTDNLQKT